jgi:hypothetical protein
VGFAQAYSGLMFSPQPVRPGLRPPRRAGQRVGLAAQLAQYKRTFADNMRSPRALNQRVVLESP